jgi:predicted alpha/beta-hydrolase family hydrolase
MAIKALKLGIRIGEQRVSGILLRPDDAKALFLFAHGAGLGMAHPIMEANARGLARRGIATLRYNFPYMEKGGGRPDPPGIAQATVRAANAAAAQFASDLPLFAGGRSYGGRMTSQAQAAAPLPGVRGLAFLGFPLHPAGQPGTDRAEHLQRIEIPMLFVSGDRDALADMSLLKPLVESLGDQATLHPVAHADHGLRVTAKSGRGPADATNEALDAVAEWMKGLL